MYQSQVASQKKIEKQLLSLKTKQSLYEHEGALWFQSTSFGDDKDRVVKKSDGSFTYLAPDIVYHKEKFERGFKKLINIWGPDHHGYIPRMKAAIEALGYNREALSVLIVQLATIYREGKPVSMSTRKGQYISLREVMDEVGVDAARFFFLMRHIGMPLEFDLDLAKKQSPENPVYYVQYAHARISSLEANALKEAVAAKLKGFHRLKEKEELALIRQLGSFPDILILCYQPRDPFPLVTYLKELATGFHKFYDTHRILNVESELAQERLALCLAVKVVLASGLKLLGLSTPQKM
jgi:arginyl-tRNA synthetase